ncbi:bacterial proteasome activator family protein [Natronoglycomyces albus]|uniref:Bacterial proteasome activator n=1 Tax=Natronoglycomyces albus TaxID=2811108 RepID=A0A895XS08_9ACTN|nr:bacterial proteasome activator family protein [Natronoglycomyces albus]QSB05346.1 bacterial proteasome activator family protein [Natronoglycomyces albus]
MSDKTTTSDEQARTEGPESTDAVVLDAEGNPVESQNHKATDAESNREAEEEQTAAESDPSKLVEQPAKVMRIGSMIKQLLEEVREATLDEKGRQRLAEIHARSIAELESGLAPELQDELERLSLPFTADETPTDAELRIAQAQLVGWLEGLFHGIQAALVAQQMAAKLQLDQMRRGEIPALPAGAGNLPPSLQAVMAEQGNGDEPDQHPGQYL